MASTLASHSERRIPPASQITASIQTTADLSDRPRSRHYGGGPCEDEEHPEDELA